MINLINDLFRSYCFTGTEVDKGHFFSTGEAGTKAEFWLVIQESDLGSFIDRQPDFFEACKKVCRHPALNKNVSMLILWETSGDLDLGTLKKKVMLVEEDPYFFKKYVLYFSGQERDSLTEAMPAQALHYILQTQIPSQETFAQYKENPLLQNWQPLLYRIAIKVPFVEIALAAADGPISLHENNKERIKSDKDKILVDFDHRFFEILGSNTSSDIKDSEIRAAELLTKLLPTLEGTDDGD